MSAEVLLICGFDRSGKTTASKILKDNGFEVFECGAVIKELSKSLNKIEVSEFYAANMSDHNSLIMQNILAISSFTEKLAIIGVRSFELYSILREEFPALKAIFIESESVIRYQRYRITSDTDALEFNMFLTNDSMQTTWGLEKIKFLCDFAISNNGDYLQFAHKVNLLVKEL